MADPTGGTTQNMEGTTSTTITIDTTDAQTQTNLSPLPSMIILHRAPRVREHPQTVSWTEGTIDNELMNRKKSKKCCIFHKKRDFDESSSSSSSSDEDHPHDHGASAPQENPVATEKTDSSSVQQN